MRQSIEDRLFNEIRKTLPEVPRQSARILARRLTNIFVFHDDEDETWYDVVSLPGGLILRTHSATVCNGEVCCVHNPSDHHMRTWDQEWMPRQQIMMRVCDHLYVHPDPDDLNARRPDVHHPCDGCCDPDATVQVS